MVRGPLGPLGARFAAAFVAVSLFAVAVFSVAVLIADRSNVTHLAATERDHTAGEVVALVENAYRTGGGWPGADLQPVSAFAAAAGVTVRLTSPTGEVLLPGPSAGAGAPAHRAVERTVNVGGRQVGTTIVEFPLGGANPADSHLRSSLTAAVALSAGLAAFAALIVGVLMARGVVRPLRRLAGAVRSLRLGERSPRVGPSAGPGELGELGEAFDAMAESLEREDRLRRALVADVAHELRTPVAIMQAETEALSDGLTAATHDAMTSLHEEAVRLARLVEDLLTLASAHSAGLELSCRPLDLGKVTADAVASLASRFHHARIDLREDLPPTMAIGDPDRLHQVAVNLLTNALKFTPAGGIVTVHTFTDEAEAVLEVADSGPGVPECERDAVWERFYRSNAVRGGPGSGIGLAVVKELVEAHGGTVGLGGAPGGGACFIVRLPTAPGCYRPTVGFASG
jgi:two-component system sensor histidine kinase BaeS